MTIPDNAPSKQKTETASVATENKLSSYRQLEAFAAGIPAIGMEAHKKFMASMAIPEGKTKQETYDDALGEQKSFGMELVGFENDRDFDGLLPRLVEVFGQQVLDECLIDKIVYDSDHVLLQESGNHYEVPAENYLELLETIPEIEQFRVRAFNTSNRNTHPAAKRYQRMPIALYSFVGERLDTKDYLPDGLSDEDKMKAYKVGTVVHEVAHSIKSYLISAEEWQHWEDLNSREVSLTQYAEQYIGRPSWSEEQFAEAVRLYATNRQYIEVKSPEITHFLEAKLPALNPDSI